MLNALLKRLDGFFRRRSKRTILFLSLLSILVLCGVEYLSNRLSLTARGAMSETLLPTYSDLLLLYLVPIFFASWYSGWRSGLVVAIWAGMATFVMETMSEGATQFQPHLLIALAVRTLAFLIIAQVIARLHETRRQQEELANFIVHDLRSPLASSITGLVTLQQSSHELEEGDREMVELALVNNNRALSLVNSILDVAKLESGKMTVECLDVKIKPFIEETLQQLELWARGHGIDLEPDVQTERGRFDPILTGRVLVNLLSNALKFSPPDGKVTVQVSTTHGALRFSVSDRGAGISQEDLEEIFQPFGQVKGTQGGTGLGLTFCRLAVMAQGGRIWVESHPGKGSTFHFSIPQHGHLG
jgi:signal transduction histidine kinase